MTKDPDIKDYTITIILAHEDFQASMGRKAKDQAEFDDGAYFAKKGPAERSDRLGHPV